MYDSINNSRTVTRPTSPREYEYESQRGIKSARIDLSGESRNLTENFMKNELLNFKKQIQGVVSEKPVPKGRNTGVHQAYYTQGATSSCSINMTPRTRKLSPVVQQKRDVDGEYGHVETPTNCGKAWPALEMTRDRNRDDQKPDIASESIPPRMKTKVSRQDGVPTQIFSHTRQTSSPLPQKF